MKLTPKPRVGTVSHRFKSQGISIENRLRAEQKAQQMIYVLQRERSEAQRKLIEAEGIRDANQRLSEGLTPEVLRFKAIEALHNLATSPNAKLIITNNRNPLSLDDDRRIQLPAAPNKLENSDKK